MAISNSLLSIYQVLGGGRGDGGGVTEPDFGRGHAILVKILDP